MGVVVPQALLSAPNPDDPLDTNIAEQWKSNEAAALATGAPAASPTRRRYPRAVFAIRS